jgi:hypothetical protein
VMTSFLIDADVFAVLSRATGVASTIHPFVVKNGIVYINKAVLDSADINSLVANYISVTELVGLNIKGATISGTNIIGGSLNIGAGKAIINSAGKATLQDADITGKVTANSGTFDNVIIAESCEINGTLRADRIIGLPSGKSFGPISGSSDSTSWATVLSSWVDGSNGMFPMSFMLGGDAICRLETTYPSQSFEVQVLANGNQIFYETVNVDSTNLWFRLPALGRKLFLPSVGATIQIQIKGRRVQWSWPDPYIYYAIDR